MISFAPGLRASPRQVSILEPEGKVGYGPRRDWSCVIEYHKKNLPPEPDPKTSTLDL